MRTYLPVERRTTIGLAAAFAVCVGALWFAPTQAQEIDPEIEASYDTPEMRRLVDDAKRLPIEDHAALVMRLRAALDERLLTPEPEIASRWAELEGAPDSGVARVLTRGLFDDQTLVRGGGAYFSFVTKSNSYNDGPDVELQKGCLRSGFYGGCFGVVAPLDVRDVRAVQEADVPDALRGEWESVKKQRDPRASVEAEEGRVYAVRSVRFKEADSLSVFQVIGMDRHGITIAWRRLRLYDTPER